MGRSSYQHIDNFYRFLLLHDLETWPVPIPVWLLYISMLLDDFSSVPEVVRNSLFYRLIFVAWGPVAILLTNCYSGLMISELNAPLRQARSQNFEDLICKNRHIYDSAALSKNFTELGKNQQSENYKAYWGKMHYIFNPAPKFKNPFATDSCYRMLSSPKKTEPVIPAFYKEFVINF